VAPAIVHSPRNERGFVLALPSNALDAAADRPVLTIIERSTRPTFGGTLPMRFNIRRYTVSHESSSSERS
jgi:hypothetical protein